MGYLGRDRLREGKVRISERERGQAEMIKKKKKNSKDMYADTLNTFTNSCVII